MTDACREQHASYNDGARVDWSVLEANEGVSSIER